MRDRKRQNKQHSHVTRVKVLAINLFTGDTFEGVVEQGERYLAFIALDVRKRPHADAGKKRGEEEEEMK